MEYYSTVVQVRSIYLNNMAREVIETILLPTFEHLQTTYRTAVNWCIAVYIDKDIEFYQLITSATVDPNAGADNPFGTSLHINPFNQTIFDILSTISDMLMEEEKKYGIKANYVPTSDETVTLYVFTMRNSQYSK